VTPLPPGVRLDPKRGLHGANYVLITCPICGEEHRHALSWFRGRQRMGCVPMCCSLACGAELRRRNGRRTKEVSA
jgi:RNase P subunit RPR2